jgi:hypothetical protein
MTRCQLKRRLEPAPPPGVKTPGYTYEALRADQERLARHAGGSERGVLERFPDGLGTSSTGSGPTSRTARVARPRSGRAEQAGHDGVSGGVCGDSAPGSVLAGMPVPAGTPRGARPPHAPPGTSSWPACSARLATLASLRARYRTLVRCLLSSYQTRPGRALEASARGGSKRFEHAVFRPTLNALRGAASAVPEGDFVCVARGFNPGRGCGLETPLQVAPMSTEQREAA